MTRDDIVKWAHEAGMIPPGWGATENQWYALEVFADLVSIAQNEKCAMMCVDDSDKEGWEGRNYADMILARWGEE